MCQHPTIADLNDGSPEIDLLTIHHQLSEALGPLHWWPGDSQLEIVVGAILTQNTNWKNVEKAIANLKQANLLNLTALTEPKFTTEVPKMEKIELFLRFQSSQTLAMTASLFSKRRCSAPYK